METPNFKNSTLPLEHSAERYWATLEDVWLKTRVLNKQLSLPKNQLVCWKVNKGFKTDGASIPRAFWSWVNPTDWRVLVPAVGHDYLCRYLEIFEAYIYDENTREIVDYIGNIKVSRQQADKFMLEKMESFNAGVFVRYPVFIAIYLYGLIFK